MSYFLFIDESGTDGAPPYEVLAGLAIEDKELWNLILAVHSLEESIFGRRMSFGSLELKGKKLLKAKTFKHASQMPEIVLERRRELALSCLRKGDDKQQPTREELTALGQAKIAFVREVLAICARFRVKAFACIVDKDAPRPDSKDVLWKNYSYLFERYFYFLEDNGAMGTIIFDELERSQCHLLVNQMEKYFLHTHKGKMRSSLVIPEPFFVHSDLTTAIQLVDVIAYIISWGLRISPKMSRPAREDLGIFADSVRDLGCFSIRDEYRQWSFVPLNSLLPGGDARMQ